MKVLIDDFALHYPGIEKIEHVYFHAVHGADDASDARSWKRPMP